MSNCSTLPISPKVAEQAASDYLAIAKAGMLDILEVEIREAVRAHEALIPDGWLPGREFQNAVDALRLDRWKRSDGWYLREPYSAANDLATLLECPLSAVAPYIVPELIDGPTRRSIILDCLLNVANHARQEMAERRRPARRRSA